MAQRIVYVIGNTKNAGKTTVVKHLLKQMKNACIASIGLDGENLDTLSNVPKPSIQIPAGTYVVSCEKFLQGSHFELLELLEDNPLAGAVFLARALVESKVVIAGANTSVISSIQKRKEFDNIIVDGALDRIVHAGFADNAEIAIVIGASNHSNTVELQRFIERILSSLMIPLAPFQIKKLFENKHTVCGLTSDGKVKDLGSSLLNDLKTIEKYEWIFVPGVITEEIVERLRDIRICLLNPFSFFGIASKFDNIYTMRKLFVRGIYLNFFNRPDLEIRICKTLESFGYKAVDILYVTHRRDNDG
ncbi:hypothetical protein [Pseudothermotoga elfii]